MSMTLLQRESEIIHLVRKNVKIEKTIGEGTFGKVKLGIHLTTGEKVAIKILEKEKILEPEDLERVNREISYLKKLNHQNIIKIYEVSIILIERFLKTQKIST
jgi:5'-AMP-activated protein kinase catalytic alpha subunit